METSSRQIEENFAVKALVSLLYVKLFRLMSVSHFNAERVSLYEDYYRDFQSNIKTHDPFSKSIAQYASE